MDGFIPSQAAGTAEIVFFDLETTVPRRAGQRFWVLEFGAIIVCPRKLVELESFSTLIKPKDLSAVALKSSRCDGITREAVEMWAGHNIRRFDCARIKEAFAEIGKPAPVPVGMIDSLGVLTEKFGRRAGNMKMATLASYFGLGQQKHRSLDDVRMNLEVLKHCATVLFLESSLPNIFNSKLQSSLTVTTRSRSNGKLPIYCVNLKEASLLIPYSSILIHCFDEQENDSILQQFLLCLGGHTFVFKYLPPPLLLVMLI
ncbi:protein NEN4 [Citrus sinensis]|uniref:Protein NEN4 n=1 Tax=Citrus sinensis TaxID=2711 RepID=A0ACB8JKX7_CITSI|nr:protein NEN4 [Citrus sinensis]